MNLILLLTNVFSSILIKETYFSKLTLFIGIISTLEIKQVIIIFYNTLI